MAQQFIGSVCLNKKTARRYALYCLSATKYVLLFPVFHIRMLGGADAHIDVDLQ